MKELVYTLFFVLISVVANGQAKYVFYFIGDGMGINRVNGMEMYQVEIQNSRIGVESLLFTQSSVITVATVFLVKNPMVDPAAAGTVLAIGKKTYNGAVSVGEDKNAIQAVAEKVKKAGKKVGVTTSVSVDHATPTAFYTHQPDRNMSYEIAPDLPKANFDFHAGGGFLRPTTTYDKKEAPSISPTFKEAGYTVVRGYNDYKAKAARAEKMILIQEEGANPSRLLYAIDHKENDLILAQITESVTDFLTKGNNKGFFLMVGGGKTDQACRANDATTVLNEVKDMDNAIKVAYEFYKKHSKEMLIVTTADHETGGIVLGMGKYALNPKALQYQRHSADGLSQRTSELRKSKGSEATWEDTKTFLSEEMGFWKQLPLSWEQEKTLRDESEKSFVKNKVVFAEGMHSKNEPTATHVKEVMDEIAMIGWVSGRYSAGYVPIFAIGAGSQLFGEKIDDTEIPKRIAEAAGYK